MELVQQAIAMDARSREELTAAIKDITKLENPNSVLQMKRWFSDNGVETDSLDKKAIAELAFPHFFIQLCLWNQSLELNIFALR